MGVEVLGIEGPHLGAHPALGVHSVRDRAHRLLFVALEEVAPHGGRDLAVQLAHPVRARGEADREGGHVEVAVVRPQGEGVVGVAADLPGPELEVAADELLVEGFVARGDRGVGGEDGVASHRLQAVRQAVSLAHPLADSLEVQERHVPLVHVPDRGVDAEGGKRARPAHSEHDFLADAHLAPSHVQHAGDGPVRGIVQGDVGVQHQYGHEADLGLPNRGLHDAPGKVDGHREHPAPRSLHGLDGEPCEVVVRIDVLLEAVGVHRLAEIAGAVEEPHPHQGNPEVAGRLAVIARQDPQAPGVDAQRLVDPELHREVGHGAGKQAAVLVEPARARAVLVEGQDHMLVGAAELGIGEQPHPLLGLDVDEELDGVVVAAPVLGVDPGEEPGGEGRPAPPEVIGQLAQALKAGRELDVGRVKGTDLHVAGPCFSWDLSRFRGIACRIIPRLAGGQRASHRPAGLSRSRTPRSS